MNFSFLFVVVYNLDSVLVMVEARQRLVFGYFLWFLGGT